MEQIARAGSGVIVLIVPRSASGASLHTAPHDDPDVDRRSYGVGAQILADLGVHDIALLTSSPHPQLVGLEAYGLNIARRQPFDVAE